MKTPVKGNRDVLVKESRLEIRLSKVQKETIKNNAEKENVKMLMLQSGDVDSMAKEKPQEVAQDGGAVWVILFVVIVLVALGYSVLTLI